MKSVIVIFTFLITALQVYAQKNCGTSGYWQEQLSTNPLLRERYQRINNTANKIVKKKSGFAVSDMTIIIPVVVHVLYNTENQRISKAQIQTQIDALNNDFGKLNADTINIPKPFAPLAADCKIQFALARVDPEGYATTGIVYKKTNETSWKQDDKMKFSSSGGDDAWDSRYYLNIWVCNLSKSLLGYATFPGSDLLKDGVVIRTDIFGTMGNESSAYSRGRTTTHEAGHWLNLKHLWGDTDCGDDGVDDTPQQKTYNTGCSSFPKITAGSCNTGNNGDMFMNYMDFSDDACMLMFTYGQKQRMRRLFDEDGARATILQSYALGEAWKAKPAEEDSVTTATGIAIYPNPSVNEIYFRDSQGKTITPDEYRIYDVKGKLLIYGYKHTLVNISKLATGIYFTRIQYAGGQRVIKFVKQ
ncbi:zinc metalloprotease [Terrimonas sp.]|uniref:M43 family zinc metalloprotease n=1 Tax=Terrimonas sp. TaxID=1914338 RepID=UPI000D50747A|nr:M43 family zinc metalloprotease [Terrimonas sp.]PVD50604.1 zinc metalloprotease [Terrimonas sp.]